jgi:hypothetical protein
MQRSRIIARCERSRSDRCLIIDLSGPRSFRDTFIRYMRITCSESFLTYPQGNRKLEFEPP